MSKQVIKNYTFNTSTKTITFSDFSTVALERLALITDTTTNQILYNFADSSGATAAVSGNVVTLSSLPSGVGSGDKLRIDYNTTSSDPTYDNITVDGTVASGATDSGNPIKVGGRYNATPPALSDGQRADLQLDSSGRLQVNTAPLTATADTIALSDGTNTANILSNSSTSNAKASQAALLTAGAYQELTSLSAGALNADLIPSMDISNYAEIALMVTGTFSGTLTVSFSNDNSNFFPWAGTVVSGGGAGNTITATGMYRIVPMGRYMRVRMTSYTSGTAAGVAELYTFGGRPMTSAQYTFAPNGTIGSAVPSTGFYNGMINNSGNLQGMQSSLRLSSSQANNGNGDAMVSVGAAAQYSTTAPAPSAGNYSNLQIDANANLKVAAQASAVGGYAYNHQSANGTTTIKSGAGTLHAVIVNTAGASDTITLYDNTAGSGSIIAVIAGTAQTCLTYGLAFATGLTAVIAGTTTPDVTFLYK